MQLQPAYRRSTTLNIMTRSSSPSPPPSHAHSRDMIVNTDGESKPYPFKMPAARIRTASAAGIMSVTAGGNRDCRLMTSRKSACISLLVSPAATWVSAVDIGSSIYIPS